MCHVSLHKNCSSLVKNAIEEVLCILQSALLDSGVAGQALLATLLNSCGKKKVSVGSARLVASGNW